MAKGLFRRLFKTKQVSSGKKTSVELSGLPLGFELKKPVVEARKPLLKPKQLTASEKLRLLLSEKKKK